MFVRLRVVLAVILVFTSFALAKDKKKESAPNVCSQGAYRAGGRRAGRGYFCNRPGANRTAQEDVEKAIMKWGWLTPEMDLKPPISSSPFAKAMVSWLSPPSAVGLSTTARSSSNRQIAAYESAAEGTPA